ncbi:MAG: RagB/SusD family nutrient uptake outer membrane protein, partial [Gemmatimonadota bacterium]
MTRRLLTTAFALVVALGATACDDEFLTTVPPDVISSGVFWSSEGDFNVALNAAYNRMVGTDINTMYFDGATDIGYSHADWMRQHEYAMGRQDALSGWSGGIWNRTYEGISRANEVLEQLEAVGGDVLSSDAYTMIEGQALFLRGYFYHELLWMFGEVPLLLNVPTAEEAREVTRASRSAIYAQIMSDLTAAANVLPESWPASEYGRATKGAALGYQARTALYEGSWQANHAGDQGAASQMYRTAADAAQAVMNLGVYELYPDFQALFEYEGEGSSEVIFDYQRVSGQNGWWAWVGFAPSSMGANVDVEPTRELADRFPMADGLPIDESPLYDPAPPRITYSDYATAAGPTVETLGMYANRDPRFYATFIFPGAEFNGAIYNSYPSCSGGAPQGYCSPTS